MNSASACNLAKNSIAYLNAALIRRRRLSEKIRIKRLVEDEVNDD